MSEFPKRKLLKLDKTSVEGRGTSGECRGSSDTETRNLVSRCGCQVSGVSQIEECRVSSVVSEKSNQLSVNSNSTLGRNSTKIFI
jgi:hypothetical protein